MRTGILGKGGLIRTGLLLVVVFSLSACSGVKKSGLKTIEGDPEKLYKKALILFNKREYPEALKIFEDIKSGFPDSPPYSIWAELKVADCHYFTESYVEAAAAYEEFKKIHPTHEEIPYVQYQIGMCYYSQKLSYDRDQTFTRRALSSFEYLIANYPPSLFTESATEKVEVCKNRLADHEFYVGNFYYRHGKYQGAILRFAKMVDQYPEAPNLEKALFLLGKSQALVGQREKAEATFTKLLNEFPGSPYSKEAQAILDHGLEEEAVSDEISSEHAGKPGQDGGGKPEMVLAKFEDERRMAIPLGETKKGLPGKGTGKETSHDGVPESAKPPMTRQESSKPASSELQGETEIDQKLSRVGLLPQAENRQTVPPNDQPRVEIKPEEETRLTALASVPRTLQQEGKPGGEKSETERTKVAEFGEPIDITSDLVETHVKENRIIFKGNVTARQRGVVIYADSLEAVVSEGGKAIEKVIAGGNVRIQQGLRVASCQKAVFYNMERRVVLTGEPKVWEGDNVVSGDEIIVDVEGNRVEVKGGKGGRGKARIQP